DGQACRINALTGTPGDAGAPARLPIRPLCKRTSADAAAFKKGCLISQLLPPDDITVVVMQLEKAV
ncbi:hypothetical protein B5E65_12040, partial [Gemmiger sp. An120]